MDELAPKRPHRGFPAGKQKPTPEEIEERITMAGNLWLLGKMRKSDIKRAMAAKYGLRPRTVENYLTAAKKRAISDTGDTPEEWKAKIIHRLESIYAKTQDTVPLSALRALEDLIELLGLKVTKISVTDPSGSKPGGVKVTHDIAKELEPYVGVIVKHTSSETRQEIPSHDSPESIHSEEADAEAGGILDSGLS